MLHKCKQDTHLESTVTTAKNIPTLKGPDNQGQ